MIILILIRKLMLVEFLYKYSNSNISNSYMATYLFYNPKTDMIESESSDVFESAKPEGVYHFEYFYDEFNKEF